MPHRQLPTALARATDALPEAGSEASGPWVVTWSPLITTIEGPRQTRMTITPDVSVAVLVSRTQTRRKLLRVLPWGRQDWLHVALRTPRAVWMAARAPVEAELVEGLPWSGDEEAATLSRAAALALVEAPLRAGAKLAAWPEAETIAPEARAHPGHTTVKPEPEELDPEVERRRWQLARHALASLSASAGLAMWFFPGASWAATCMAPAALAFIGVCSVGPPQTALMTVYGSVAVVGWPFLSQALGLHEEPWSQPSIAIGAVAWALAVAAANVMVHLIRPVSKDN